MAQAALADALARARAHAPFLAALARREAALVQSMLDRGEAALPPAIEEALASSDDAGVALRRARRRLALGAALLDLAGAWPLERLTAELSGLQDLAVGRALDAAWALGGFDPGERRGVAVIALGKLGSRELNYSSDIDLLVLHDPDRVPRRPRLEPGDVAARLVQRMVRLLAEPTAEGMVARVDLRLRPRPDASPLSVSREAAELYYQSEAWPLERVAFIRARPLAGDHAVACALLDAIEPFVWRRSLDWSTVGDIAALSHDLREHHADGQRVGPGYDVKRGRGGIREAEFAAHIPQLIFGGRDPSLRTPATVDALAALVAAGRMAPEDAARLTAGYRHLRQVEHRLQMLRDEQTHMLPRHAEERRRVAGLMGAAGWAQVEAGVARHAGAIGACYDQLTAEAPARRRLPRGDRLAAWARSQRLAAPDELARLVARWRQGGPRALRAPEAREALEQTLPVLLPAVARAPDGAAAVNRLALMIDRLPSGVQFWRLLAAHPPLVERLAGALRLSPTVSDELARRPTLVDCLIDPLPPLGHAGDAVAELEATGRGLEGEALLDRVRRWTAERRFMLGLELLEGRLPPLDAARRLAWLAEAAVATLAHSVATAYARQAGTMGGGALVVLALGRLATGFLTHRSDLDLVLVHTGPFDARARLADGTEGMGASGWFNRLGQRLVAALSVPTAEGALYDVDTRLRPSGADGPLVVSLEALEAYLTGPAEVWERMAFLRARPVGGPAHARAEAAARLEALPAAMRLPAAQVRREALAMRLLMERHKAAAGPGDVKLARGGLVDLEFVVDADALERGRALADWPSALAEHQPALVEPWRLMMAVLLLERLLPSAGRGREATRRIAEAVRLDAGPALPEALAEARSVVAAAFEAQLGRRPRATGKGSRA